MIPLDVSLENLYRQYHACRRNKRNTVNALRFEVEQEKNLIDLHEALVSRTYRPGRSVCFFATKPKLREIFAADFRDRVVHHLLVDYLERIWEPVFIHDSYACRKGKGVHAGVRRLQTFLRQRTANGTRPAWFLQLDIHNYFMRIDKDILFRLLTAKLSDETALWLTRTLVYHDCTSDYVLRGNPALREAVPSHKTLFAAEPHKGLPIGNLNSQFFANVYLNRLDQFVKHELKCRHYLRYCDDFVLLANDPDTLCHWRTRIGDFLRRELALELNPKQRLAPVSNGIDFLGYIVERDYLLVRRRVVGHLKAKLRAFEGQLVGTVSSGYASLTRPTDGLNRVRFVRGVRCYRFDEAVLDRLAATLSSYLGHFKLASTWCLRQSIWRQFEFLSQYFAFDEDGGKLVRLYPTPKIFQRVRNQYRYFRWRFPDDALFFQVGRFMECYDNGTPEWIHWLGLRRMGRNYRGACYGFPLHRSGRYLSMVLDHGKGVTIIREQSQGWNGIRMRAPVWRCVPSIGGSATG